MIIEMRGAKALKGAFRRSEKHPDNDQSGEVGYWDGQWPNWDDLGADDPYPGGWGDAGD